MGAVLGWLACKTWSDPGCQLGLVVFLVGAFGFGSFFVFISSASFIYQDGFGLSNVQFSLAFAVNALGFFAASQMAAKLGLRFGAQRVMVRATILGDRPYHSSRRPEAVQALAAE
mgnify:CR=1 FL=1